MEEDIIIGDRIRKIREDLKMSRETFSEMIDISDFFLGKIERGERSLSNNTLVKIVKFTDVSFAYDKQNVLRNISFKINSGEKTAIVGKTRCRKNNYYKNPYEIISYK